MAHTVLGAKNGPQLAVCKQGTKKAGGVIQSECEALRIIGPVV